MIQHTWRVSIASMLLPFLFCAESQANITLSNTRIVYPANKEEVTITVMSHNNMPVLLQNWIDNGDEQSSPETTATPFILMPPMTRIDPGKGQTLRLIYPGVQPLPSDKESVFWLNILEVPPKIKADAGSDSRLRVTFRTRVKIFYRPDGLAGTPAEAAENLCWSVQGDNINVSNPSPYFVSLATISVGKNGKKAEERARMIAPGGTDHYTFKGIRIDNIAGLTYSVINDYGAIVSYSPRGA